jgi:hypothetical protein
MRSTGKFLQVGSCIINVTLRQCKIKWIQPNVVFNLLSLRGLHKCITTITVICNIQL